MNNSKAFALAVTLSMMVLLTGLGIGILNYSGMQGRVIVNQKLATQSFWLADAGIENAKNQISQNQVPINTTTNLNGSLSTGGYSVTITNPYNSSSNQYSIVSTGTVPGNPPAVQILEDFGTITPLFNNAVISAPNSASGVTVGSGVTIDNYNSNGSAGTGTGEIETTNLTGSPSVGGVISNAGVILPTLTVPSALQSAPCPIGNGSSTGPASGNWSITSNTTFLGSGNYSCSYLYVAPGATLIINTPVVLYLTATDPATGPDPINGEDLRGEAPSNPNNGYTLGYIKILSGGSLTIYAAGRITTGNGDNQTDPVINGYFYSEALNNASFVEFLNQDPWDPDTIYPSAWNNTTAYPIGSLVLYNGGEWQSIKAGTGQIPITGSTYWESIGLYTNAVYVTYNDQAWLSTNLSGNQGQTPSATSAYWTLSTFMASSTYSVNAYVTYNGGAWRSAVGSNTGNTPGSSTCAGSPASGSACWVLSNDPIPADLIIYSLYNSPAPWSSTTTYATGDLVNYGEGAWQSIQASTDQPPAQGSAYWSSIAWNSTTNYSLGSLVYYNGQLWQSTTAGAGQTPVVNSNYWNTYAGVEINNNTDHLYGLIYAPQSLVWLNLQETYSGSVVANSVDIQSGTTVNYDQSLATDINLPTSVTFSNWKECPFNSINGC